MRVKRESLRVPEKWQGQDRAFVIQLERLMDDIYIRLGRMTEAEKKMEEEISALDDRVTELEE